MSPRKPTEVWFILALLLTSSRAFADGGFIPPKAFPKVPAIPGQTALIVHKNGIETLVVESTLQSEGGDRFAWIVPVPAEPTAMHAVSPGALRTLRMCIGGRLVYPEEFLFGLGLTLVVSLWALFAAIGIHRRDGRLIGRIRDYLVVFVILLLLASIATPNYLVAGSTPVPRAVLLRQQHVGSYEVSVLRAANEGELASWLDSNGFAPLSLATLEPIRSYIRDQWTFVVARLEHVEGRRATAHPLALTFPSRQIVYPMRLTAIGGQPTSLHLYVAGPGPVQNPLLTTMVSDCFVPGEGYSRVEGREFPRMSGREIQLSFGQPELMRWIPSGAWITCLQGNLLPHQMKEDLVLKGVTGEPKAYWRRLYTPQAAAALGTMAACALFTIAMPVCAFAVRGRRRAALGYLAVLAIVVVSGSLVSALLPKGPEAITLIDPVGSLRRTKARMLKVYEEVTAAPSMDLDARVKACRERLTSTIGNPFEDGPIREEASPGNYTLTTDDSGRLILYLYGDTGELIAVPSRKDASLSK